MQTNLAPPLLPSDMIMDELLAVEINHIRPGQLTDEQRNIINSSDSYTLDPEYRTFNITNNKLKLFIIWNFWRDDNYQEAKIYLSQLGIKRHE